MNATLKAATMAAILAVGGVTTAQSASYLYGDEDGFGLGLVDGDSSDPQALGAGDGDGTDARLIGSGFLAPAFTPSGGFSFGAITESIVSATLTISMLGFDSGPNPVDGPNDIKLDGVSISGLLSQFATTSFPEIVETFSVSLDSSLYASLADGSVSLFGTSISEDSGSGSFAIDYLRLDIETAPAVPVPASLPLLMAGVGAFGLYRRRQTKAQA